MNKKCLLISLIILMLFSVANNYYANLYLSSYHNYYLKQLIWYVLGFIVIIILSKVNIDFLINNSFYFYLLYLLLYLIQKSHYFLPANTHGPAHEFLQPEVI